MFFSITVGFLPFGGRCRLEWKIVEERFEGASIFPASKKRGKYLGVCFILCIFADENKHMMHL